MRETVELLRHERRARLFFLALAQSALGTGAGYIALLLIAYERFESPWAISLVLIADLIPAMLLGPVFGAAADRWSRKRCAVIADVVRVIAFGGIALVDSYAATIAFAILAGTGTGLFTPSTLAALPSVVDEPLRVPAATSLYGAVADFGFTVGPAVAAGVLALGGPETLMWANAVTFALSALVLAPLRFGEAPDRSGDSAPASLLAEARDGLRATAGMRAIRIVVLATSAAVFGAGLFNIAELFFATEDLDASDAGFAVLVTCFGIGFITGSFAGAKGGPAPLLKRRYLVGLLFFASGFLATGLAGIVGVALVPDDLTGIFVIALATFGFAGFGNGLVLVYERLLIQEDVPDELVGRVFGIRDALSSWAFAVAFLAGGALLQVIEARELIAIAGGVGLVSCAASALALRDEWPDGDDGAAPSGVSELAAGAGV
jgi:MFS family permease